MPQCYCLQQPYIKFADGAVILGLINNQNDISYRSEVSKFVQWSNTNALQLSVNKTNEMVFGFRKNGIKIVPLKINDQIMEKVSTYEYVGVTIE